MASADSCPFSIASRRWLPDLLAYRAGLPGYERPLSSHAPAAVYGPSPWRLRTLLCDGNSSDYDRLKCGSCTSGREFASSFLQIPPCDGHPCSWLTVGMSPTPVQDLHPIEIARAGRTSKKPSRLRGNWVFACAILNRLRIRPHCSATAMEANWTACHAVSAVVYHDKQ